MTLYTVYLQACTCSTYLDDEDYETVFRFSATIQSDFSRSNEGWTAAEGGRDLPLRFDAINKLLGVQAGSDPSTASPNGVYFSAPGWARPPCPTWPT